MRRRHFELQQFIGKLDKHVDNCPVYTKFDIVRLTAFWEPAERKPQQKQEVR